MAENKERTERIFLNVTINNDGDYVIKEVDEREELSYNYVDDKLHITVYGDVAMDFSAGLYIGIYLAGDFSLESE